MSSLKEDMVGLELDEYLISNPHNQIQQQTLFKMEPRDSTKNLKIISLSQE